MEMKTIVLSCMIYLLAQDSVRTEKPSLAEPHQVCNKKCDNKSVMKKLCLNDFAIRGRVEEITKGNNGNLQLEVRVTKRYKLSRVSTGHRIMMEVIGKEVTCTCEPIKIRKTFPWQRKEKNCDLFLGQQHLRHCLAQRRKKVGKITKEEEHLSQTLRDTLVSTRSLKNLLTIMFTRICESVDV
ncbi:uncharacterized protein LOC124439322 [Xenia sp. Carnegie-2017]|uniref:uncharacterized protein LOC124439322 n=1 Tax=Xenia sp. Carnegie-2017 TaxID=2897299 RepID=UPI001F037F17|nr:uncharacterized protein LOC124439322 [Xenia sp. Carnegie-2017]